MVCDDGDCFTNTCFVMSHLLGPLYLLIRRETDHLVRLTSQQLQGIRVIKAFNQTQKNSKHLSSKICS